MGKEPIGRAGATLLVGKGPPLKSAPPGSVYLDADTGNLYRSDDIQKFDPDEPRDEEGRWTDGSGGDGATSPPSSGGGGHATVATDLYHANGGAGKATAKDIIDRHGAADKIRGVEDRLASSVPTNAPVSQGGYVRADGTYTPERQALHTEVLNKVFNEKDVAAAMPGPGEKPRLDVLGGRGGSGKSFLTKPGGPVNAKDALLLDSDRIKGMLPEYQGWNAAMLHEEASHILNQADRRATELGINTIHDGTLKTEKSVAARVDQYRAKGYDVNGYFVHTTPETAADRALGRFMRGGETGRYVPPDVILNNTTNEQSFDHMKSDFAHWQLYDNNGKAPKLIAEGRK